MTHLVERIPTRRALLILTLGLVAMFGVGLRVALETDDTNTAQDQRIAVAAEQADALEDDVATLATAFAEANAQLVEAGEPPVPVPETDTTLPGVDGIDGLPGDDGLDGLDGQDGADGKTGPRGRQGPRGPAGPAGPTGETGAPGAPGEQGPAGAAGPAGPAGAAGQDGAPGTDGKDGTATPGTYTCPNPDQYVYGFTVGPGGDVTLDCRSDDALVP